MAEVLEILHQNDLERDRISKGIKSKETDRSSLELILLEPEKIYHLDDIKKLCINYRLRFLDSHFFKGDIPEEAITKVRLLEKKHQISIAGFKIMAPSSLLKLENADDPLLFVPIGNEFFYLVHKWGNDLHPFRKILMWPYKTFENLVFTVFLLSIALTSVFPMELLAKTVTPQEYVLFFLFMFKAVGGIVLFYGFAKGKNFNSAIWDSKYYNA